MIGYFKIFIIFHLLLLCSKLAYANDYFKTDCVCLNGKIDSSSWSNILIIKSNVNPILDAEHARHNQSHSLTILVVGSLV